MPVAAPTPPAPRADKAVRAAKPAKPAGRNALERLGLRCELDLALHLPLRYEDETRIVGIAGARAGETVQVEGVVRSARVEPKPRRQFIVCIADETGELLLRFLHFWPSHQRALQRDARVRARGEVRAGFHGREIVHPAFKIVGAGTPLAAALTPVYPAGAEATQAMLRGAIEQALPRAPLDELLPAQLVPAGLPALRAALETLHHPPAGTPIEAIEDRSHPAWRRLKFDELLAQQLAQLQARAQRSSRVAPPLAARPAGMHEQLLARLPFELTRAQRRVAEEIASDLARATPMHRLLQGDVGSGKTVVAALAAAIAIDSGWQCALMAPTEILAVQHWERLVGWLEPLLAPLDKHVAWIAGARRGRAREAALERIASGSAALVVGTHAIIQNDVRFARLGLAIVDEQHRFGVVQRLELRRKLAQEQLEPHLLMMSATPIPRTLAMSAFADLDLSTIDELPPGRKPVATRLFADERRADVIERIREQVRSGRQVYWVCPLVEESEALDLANAKATREQLGSALAGYDVGLLHGRMPAAEKTEVLARFASGALPVLVATTVIEVGVDVPNASLMVVEHAERFGLAQLHQLRGRIGRGAQASVCVLLYAQPLSASGKARLKTMLETSDGFEIARRDLEIRGPGEFLGAQQSGLALLRFADLTDPALLSDARRVAETLLREHPQAAAAHLERWLAGRADFLKA